MYKDKYALVVLGVDVNYHVYSIGIRVSTCTLCVEMCGPMLFSSEYEISNQM